MSEFWFIVGGYVVVFVGTIFLLNFLSRGFLLAWLRVLISRGKLILVQVRNPISNYFITGKLAGGEVIVRDFESKEKSSKKNLLLRDDCVFRSFGVPCIYYDESTNEIFNVKLENYAGHDLIRWDNNMVTALMRPENQDLKKFQMIVYIGLAVVVVGLALVYFQTTNIIELLQTSEGVAGGVLSGFVGFRIRKRR